MSPPKRRCLQGVLEILTYNRHQYLGAVTVLTLSGALLLLLDLPDIVSYSIVLIISIVGYWTFASIVVSFIVYDVSRINDRKWIRDLLKDAPSKWASLHAGVDNFNHSLSGAFGIPSYNWDIFDWRTMTEPSILRARAIRSDSGAGNCVDFRTLPCRTGELDAIFAFFVLHEIRQHQLRQDCFDEIARCTAPDGRLIVVEHLRDVANFLAFGPGFFHFLPRSEWLRLASTSGFVMLGETTMTPFVRVMILGKVGG